MENLFDRPLLIKRKRHAAQRQVAGSEFLMRRTCEDLADRLSVIERKFDHAVTLFCGGRDAADVLRASGKIARITQIEADRAFLPTDAGIVEPDEVVPVEPESADLVVSLLALHEVNDVPGMLAQIRHALKPDGLFLAAFAGSGTLGELRESFIAAETDLAGGAAARVYPFMDVRDAGALLQRAGFALPVADNEAITARYDTAIGLVRDLRAMGATSALANGSRKPLSRPVLERIEDYYSDRYSDEDGRIRATFNVIWVSGWAPHPSQQKPLKPGSAVKRLDEVLQEIESDKNSPADPDLNR